MLGERGESLNTAPFRTCMSDTLQCHELRPHRPHFLRVELRRAVGVDALKERKRDRMP